MSASKTLTGAAVAKAVCLTQLAIAAAAALLAVIFWGRLQGVSALYGGAIAVVPTFYFAIRIFSRRSQEAPSKVVGAIFRGEIGKFALTGVMFWIGVKLFATQFLALLATYVACLMAYWIVMARASFGGTDGTH